MGIKWLRPEQVKDLNERALYEGEPHKVIGDLQGAVNRPRGHYHFADTTSPYDLAALYAVALVKAHAFQDGNKRTALLAIRVFLRANGLEFDYGPYDEEVAEIMTGIATGSVNRSDVVEWIRGNTEGAT